MKEVAPEHLSRLFEILERRGGLRRDVSDPDVARAVLAPHADRGAWLDALDRSPQQLLRVLERFTVHESYLFRHPEQLDAFAGIVLDECKEAKAATRTLRILSAGCAGGEEVWSLAITLRERAPELAGWDVRILGVDASAPAIAKATAGVYGKWSLRATPDAVRDRWLRPTAPGRWAVDDALRAGVTFETRNLVDPGDWLWPTASFDVVFFRNVAIYFSDAAFREILQRFQGLLRPGGWLFLGPSESVRGLGFAFDLVASHGAFVYQRRPDAGATPASRRPAPKAPRRSADAPAARPAAPPRPAAAPSPGPAAPRSAPARPGPAPPPDEILAARAIDHLRREEFDRALAALDGMRDEARRELLRAVAFTNQGRHADAAEACRRVLALDPRSAAARYLVALGLEHRGDPQGAYAEDAAAIDLDPTFAMPWVHLGLMARKRGDVVATRTFLTEALARLAADQPARIELFGGGFGRDALVALCRSQLRGVGGSP